MNAHTVIAKTMSPEIDPQNHPVTDAPIADTNMPDGGVGPKGLAVLMICSNLAERD